jgi:hypothetical protein
VAAIVRAIRLDTSRLFNSDASATNVLRNAHVMRPRLTRDYRDVREFSDSIQAGSYPKPMVAHRVKGRSSWPMMGTDIDDIWRKAAAGEPAVAKFPLWLDMEKKYLVKPRGSLNSHMLIRRLFVHSSAYNDHS